MNEIVESAYDKALVNLGLNGLDSLSEAEKVVASVFALDVEVNNGGFDQFFVNSSGDLAFFVPQALRIIGAPNSATIAEKANAIFGELGPSSDSIVRGNVLQSFGEKYDEYLEALDSKFYEYPHDLYALLTQYLLKQCRLASNITSD